MEEFTLNFSEYISAFLQDGDTFSVGVGVVATIIVIGLRKLPGKALSFVKSVILAVAEKLKGG